MATVSAHGTQRIKDRCGIKKKAAKKLVNQAFYKGISHEETAGSLNRYLTSLYFYNKTANNIRIYNEKVFIFSGQVLITVLNLPFKYKKTVDKIILQRELKQS